MSAQYKVETSDDFSCFSLRIDYTAVYLKVDYTVHLPT